MMFRALIAFLLMVPLAGLPAAQVCATAGAAQPKAACSHACCCKKAAACPCEMSGKTAPQAPVSLDRAQAGAGVQVAVPALRFVLRLPVADQEKPVRSGAAETVAHAPPLLSRICIAQI
jgi:hypothetical protein